MIFPFILVEQLIDGDDDDEALIVKFRTLLKLPR